MILDDECIQRAIRADLQAVVSRDPACPGYANPLLYFKGFQAIQAYRVAHFYWMHDRKPLALYLQSRISEVFAVDIHPGARIGKGIMFDHATSVVIGETAVVEDDFSMLHEVTLGGTGKEGGDRHPKIGRGVMIGAGAKVLGNIRVGEGAKIGAGSRRAPRRAPAHHRGRRPREDRQRAGLRAARLRDGSEHRRRGRDPPRVGRARR